MGYGAGNFSFNVASMKLIKDTIGRPRDIILIFFLIFFIHIGAFFLIKEHGMMMDEHEHFRQIVRIINDKFIPDPSLPMTPGYHFVMGYSARVLGWSTFPNIRFISFIFNLATILVFYLIARLIDKGSAWIRTIQYSFLPILFPYFPLIYTDIFSLLVILLSLLALEKEHYTISGIMGAASILVRQNNLIWVVLFNLLIYVRNYGYTIKRESIRKHIKRTYAFLLAPLGFVAFYIINGGIAVGSASRQFVFISLVHPGNIFFCLFLFIFLFMPIVLSYGKELGRFMGKYKFILPAILFLYPYFALTFLNRHPFNSPDTTFFLRNELITYFGKDTLHQAIFFAISMISLVSLFVIKLRQKEYYLFYPATAIILLPVWLIEQRYFTVPFTFFLLFRKTKNMWVEYLLVILFIFTSYYLFDGIFHWKFFL